jgi:hypothetical protein
MEWRIAEGLWTSLSVDGCHVRFVVARAGSRRELVQPVDLIDSEERPMSMKPLGLPKYLGDVIMPAYNSATVRHNRQGHRRE